jgi:hypothetical protein
LAGSRSRAGLVAAVITRKRRTLSYFHRCEKLVESKFSIPLIVFRNFGVLPHRTFRLPLFAPCVASKYSALAPPLSDSAGLSPIEAQGASEKCAKDLSSVHISCTVFPQGRLFGTLPPTR